MLGRVGVPALLHERRRGRRRVGGSTRAGESGTVVGGEQRVARREAHARYLLGDAVHAAAAVGEHRAGDGDDLAAGILRGDDRERVARRRVVRPSGTTTAPLAT